MGKGLGARLYTPRELGDCLMRNAWTFAELLFVFPSLDREQHGPQSAYVWTWRDFAAVIGFLMLPVFVVVSGFTGFVVAILTPAVGCMFLELVPGAGAGTRYRGPRIWLPRWYLTTVGIVLLWSGFSVYLRWFLIVLWAISSWHLSKFYSSDLLFYAQVKRENPNRDHYRIAALPMIYLWGGQELQAEQEFMEVLKIDPGNERANLIVSLMQQNIRMHMAGSYMMGFSCIHCGHRDGMVVRDGVRFSQAEHNMYFFRDCIKCGRKSATGVLPE